jgi:hypothetical protein
MSEGVMIDENLLKYVSDSVVLLRPIIDKVVEINVEGLNRERLIGLLDAIKSFLKYRFSVAGVKDPIILKRLEEIRELLEISPQLPIQMRFRRHLRDLANFLESLPEPSTLLPRPRLLLTLKDIAQSLRELDELIDLLVFDFCTYIDVLTELFDKLRPEAIPALIKFISKNPGYVRTVIGEPLFIWWFSRSLSNRSDKKYWKNAKGPFVTGDAEIDVVSILCSNGCEYAIAEVELSKNLKTLEEREIERVASQVIRAATALKHVEYVKPITKECRFKEISECMCREIAVATLYSLHDDAKNKIKSIVETKAKSVGIKCIVEVYDINDVLNNLYGLREDVKVKYREMFTTINRILEATV